VSGDNETSPILTITGAAVVGVIRSGSTALAEKGRRGHSWVQARDVLGRPFCHITLHQ